MNTKILLSVASGLMVMPCAATFAQTANANASDDAVLEEVVVTGTRLTNTGFTTPTPVTVIGEEAIQERAPANIADIINEVPSFKVSRSDTARGANDSSPGVQNVLDLRALGDFRTLSLINGHRTVGTNFRGTFDTNMIPVGLVDRVEVVTGGASAAYGSDAVAGVANIILKNKMQGVSGSIQGGQTDHNDGQDINATFAAGTGFAGDRGHVIFGADYNHSKGIESLYERPWGRKEVGTLSSFPAGQRTADNLPANVISNNVEQANATAGGLVVFTNGNVVNAIRFDANGNAGLFNRGPVYGTNMVGNSANYGLFNLTPIQTPTERSVFYGRVEFDLTDTITPYLELSYGRSAALPFKTGNYISAGTTALTVTAANYPTQFAQMYALGLPAGTASVSLGRINTDLGGNTSDQTNTLWRGVAGLNGKFGESWTWDAYYQDGQSRQFFETSGLSTAALQKAVNNCAATGTTTIWENLTGKTCAPFNPFGSDRASDAVRNYVLNEQTMVTHLRQKVISASISGSPVTLWAGDLAVATGAEYRFESLEALGDPVTANGTLYSQGNFTSFAGKRNVKEAFVEAGLPLLKDVTAVKSLGLNSAIRETDYSTSGSVTTWKAGLTYNPIDAVMFRATRSRDIRAPSLQELTFVGGSLTLNTTNSIPNGTVGANGTVNTKNGTSGSGGLVAGYGNANLTPEKADTSVFGVSMTFGNLSVALDHYDIKVADAIVRLATTDTIQQCQLGSALACSGITFDSLAPTGIAFVKNQSTNSQTLKINGWDLEAAYKWANAFGGPGSLNLRGLINYAPHNKSYNPINGITTEQAGTLAAQAKVSGNLSIGYTLDQLSAQVQLRAFGKLRGNNVLYSPDGSINAQTMLGPEDDAYNVASSTSISKNEYGGRIYVNPSVQYKLTDKITLYGNVDNAFNTAPPPLTVSTAYDLIGRRYRAGIRAQL
ncbi:MAG: TonB-dependent receptor [Steroidobacteraceae bacterium]